MGWKYLEKQKEFWSGDVSLSVMNVIGSPESGKSTFVRTLIAQLFNYIPREETFYIKSRDLRDVFQEIHEEYKYHIFFIEDAGKEQSSRRSMSNSNVQLYESLPDVRHIAKRLHGLQEGRIIIFLASHLPDHVDKVIRSFESVRFYKDMNLTQDHYKKVVENLEMNYTEKLQLKDWVKAVMYNEKWALSQALTVMRSGDWDFLKFQPDGDHIEPNRDLVRYEIPDPPGTSSSPSSKTEDKSIDYEAEDLEELIETELERMIEETDWNKYAKVLKLLREGKTSLEVADKLEDVSEGSVTHHKKKALGELRRRIGLAYEELVAEELENRGWTEVDRKGGTGEPDIVAKNPDGDLVAVSVKLYSYGRTRHSIELEEFNPELNFKNNNEGAEAWLWYNNLDWGGRSGKVYFEQIPEALDRIVIKKDKGILRPD